MHKDDNRWTRDELVKDAAESLERVIDASLDGSTELYRIALGNLLDYIAIARMRHSAVKKA